MVGFFCSVLIANKIKMIQVALKNYTTIKSADFNIKGLTVLRANSNGGKSSIVNAINAGVTSEFPPSALRWGESVADIELRFADGAVKLTRTGSSTTYKIATASGVNESYEKLNRKLPETVTDFLNLCVLSIGDEPYCVNFHQQFAKPLSLAMSHNRFVSFLSSSDVLEEHKATSKKLSTKAYELQGSITSFSNLLTTTQASLDTKNAQYVYLTELGTALDAKYQEIVKINNAIAAVAAIEQRLQQVKELSALVQQKNDEITHLTGLVDKQASITPLQTRVSALLAVEEELKQVNATTTSLGVVTSLLQYLTDALSAKERQQLAQQRVTDILVVAGKCAEVLEKNALLTTKTDCLGRLNSILEKAKVVTDLNAKIQRLTLLGSSILQVEGFTKSRDDKKNILDNDLCPLCAKPLDSHKH